MLGHVMNDIRLRERKTLVLQLRMLIWRSCVVVAATGDGLMMTTPGRPGAGAVLVAGARPDDGDQQTADFRFGQRDQISFAFF